MEKSSLHAEIKNSIVQIVMATCLLAAAVAEAAMVGGESGAYLRYPVGASALAMGGAQTAAPTTLLPWWNPALLVMQKEKSASFGGGIRPFGQTDGYASFGIKVPPRMGMGLFLLYRGDPFLNDLYDENEHPLKGASFTSFTGKIALSYYSSRRLSAGCNIIINYEKIPSGYTNDGKILYTSATNIGSFDFAISYRWSDRLILAALLKDVGTDMAWNFESSYNFNVPADDQFLPALIFGSSFSGSIDNRPFIWHADIRGYLFDGTWKKLSRPEVYLSNGFEWQYWKTLYLRMGIGDILLNGDITTDSRHYWNNFALRVSGGVSVDLQNFRNGMRLNYGVSTDKVWAGVDQQLDITLSF